MKREDLGTGMKPDTEALLVSLLALRRRGNRFHHRPSDVAAHPYDFGGRPRLRPAGFAAAAPPFFDLASRAILPSPILSAVARRASLNAGATMG
jgi:hypothetical protein